MSMLAERRRKTKWVINPTKKPLWTTESNGIKFGKELMEKMGWSTGKGLGAKEQGIQEPLKVSYKNDTKGMGFKGNDDDWIEQQDEFNVLLNQLRNSDDSSVVKVSEEEKNEIKSLEEKSKQSRARVHYQKFTRGKDLSRYSENDLACILGTNKIKKEKSKTEEMVEKEEKNAEGFVTCFGVTTINSGSIQDYFKNKWNTAKVKSKNVEKEKEEHSCDERPSFSRVFEDTGEFSKKEYSKEDGGLGGFEMNGDSREKYEKRKKRKKKDVEMSEEEEPKSKRKKTSDPKDEELHNLAGASGEAETENLLGCENNCDSRKTKKEKRKSKKEEGLDGSEEAEGLEVKKKRKKERKEKPIENGYCDTEELASIDCSLKAECPERKDELVKKKKKGKPGNEVFEEAEKENIEEHSLGVSIGEINDGVKGGDVTVSKGKKKRKYKDHDGNIGVDEANEKNELGEISQICEGDTEVGSKKKKKKKEKQYEKVECHGNECGTSCEIQVEKCHNGSNSNSTTDLEIKKKKKKEELEGDKVEFHGNKNGCSSYEKCDDENNSNATGELEQVKKKKKKKEKLEEVKVECGSNGSEVSNEIQLEKCDNKSSSNSTAELEEFKKKKKKKEKEEDNMESCSGVSSETPEGRCDTGNSSNRTTEIEEFKKKKKKKEKEEENMESCSGLSIEISEGKCENENNSNSITELEEFKKKKRKKEKEEDKIECCSGLPSEIPEGKCDTGNTSNRTTEIEEFKKKKKKKEKQEDRVECNNNGNEISNEIPLEKTDGGNNSINTAELEKVKKKKKKDKHKTKEEDIDSNHMKESCLDEAHQESVNGFSESVQKKKKKKEKKEKVKSKDEGLKREEESKESCPDQQSTNGEVRSDRKRKKKESREGGEEANAVGQVEGGEGNTEIGTTAGIDKVELISQRAAYEHVAGQHRYERVKKMFEFVNLSQFRGSNLECLDGYGKRLRECEPSLR